MPSFTCYHLDCFGKKIEEQSKNHLRQHKKKKCQEEKICSMCLIQQVPRENQKITHQYMGEVIHFLEKEVVDQISIELENKLFILFGVHSKIDYDRLNTNYTKMHPKKQMLELLRNGTILTESYKMSLITKPSLNPNETENQTFCNNEELSKQKDSLQNEYCKESELSVSDLNSLLHNFSKEKKGYIL
jgi:hypothetical protein